MPKVKVKELSKEAFSIYGDYADMLNPRVTVLVKSRSCFTGICCSSLWDAAPMFHFLFVLCISGRSLSIVLNIIIIVGNHYSSGRDILMHVAPAVSDDQPPVDQIEVFHVPKGTLVVTNPGVWHQAAFPYNCKKVNILCILPERTYMNDCHLRSLPEDNLVEIQLD